MDIQKTISDVVAKLKADPNLLKNFAAKPVETLEKLLGIDLPDDQINAIIEGVKGKIDLPDLSDLTDVKKATGIIAKIKKLLGLS